MHLPPGYPDSLSPVVHSKSMPAVQPNKIIGGSSSREVCAALTSPRLAAKIPTTAAACASPSFCQGDVQPHLMTSKSHCAASAADFGSDQLHDAVPGWHMDYASCKHKCALPETCAAPGMMPSTFVSCVLHRPIGKGAEAQEAAAAVHMIDKQPCRAVLQKAELFDQVQQRRHRQASRAAKQVQAYRNSSSLGQQNQQAEVRELHSGVVCVHSTGILALYCHAVIPCKCLHTLCRNRIQPCDCI